MPTKEVKAIIRSCVEGVHSNNMELRGALCSDELRVCITLNMLQQVRASMTFFTA